jgi:hypothetical protein
VLNSFPRVFGVFLTSAGEFEQLQKQESRVIDFCTSKFRTDIEVRKSLHLAALIF